MIIIPGKVVNSFPSCPQEKEDTRKRQILAKKNES
jgi:hypothetical protein